MKQETGFLPAVSALKLNSVLTKLTLCGVNAVNATSIAKLATVFCELPTLKTLELKDSEIGSGGAEHLGKYSNHYKCIGIAVDIRKVADSTLP